MERVIIKEMNEWLPEQLKTIRNLCLTAEVLIKENRDELLPTILEFLLEEAQNIVDENCVEY